MLLKHLASVTSLMSQRTAAFPDRLLFQLVSALLFFFFNDTATTEIYTLSLHDALPIYTRVLPLRWPCSGCLDQYCHSRDRKSTRLNSSHQIISYAVFCFKKKKENKRHRSPTGTLRAYRSINSRHTSGWSPPISHADLRC